MRYLKLTSEARAGSPKRRRLSSFDNGFIRSELAPTGKLRAAINQGNTVLAQGTPAELSNSDDPYVGELLRTPRRQAERLGARAPGSAGVAGPWAASAQPGDELLLTGPGEVRPIEIGTGEILREAGYATFAVGKWHLAPRWEQSAAGPFERWPLGLGFERYYGFLNGDTNQWTPELVRDNGFVDAPKTPAARSTLTFR